jgi:hypothetical protein
MPTRSRLIPRQQLRVISGGQTGVDRAALDVAIALDVPHGGWCPLGRLAEDGRIPDCYQLQETDSPEYPVRTERNVLESDATIVLCRGTPTGGTDLTIRMARKHHRPCLVVDLELPRPPDEVRRWLKGHRVRVLNVAGPREGQNPGIGRQAGEFLRQVLS